VGDIGNEDERYCLKLESRRMKGRYVADSDLNWNISSSLYGGLATRFTGNMKYKEETKLAMEASIDSQHAPIRKFLMLPT
jgi:hypothetical protein